MSLALPQGVPQPRSDRPTTVAQQPSCGRLQSGGSCRSLKPRLDAAQTTPPQRLRAARVLERRGGASRKRRVRQPCARTILVEVVEVTKQAMISAMNLRLTEPLAAGLVLGEQPGAEEQRVVGVDAALDTRR